MLNKNILLFRRYPMNDLKFNLLYWIEMRSDKFHLVIQREFHDETRGVENLNSKNVYSTYEEAELANMKALDSLGKNGW